MLKGLYTAYTGMIQEQKRMDTLANNLANADTAGFKKEGLTSSPSIPCSWTRSRTVRILINMPDVSVRQIPV